MPLGMEDKRLREGDISASSYYNSNLAPWFGRLNHLYAWMARTRNSKQWLKINLGYVTRCKGIATQGRSNSNQWVTSYVVTFSRYGNTYVTYKENKKIKVSRYLCRARMTSVFKPQESFRVLKTTLPRLFSALARVARSMVSANQC